MTYVDATLLFMMSGCHMHKYEVIMCCFILYRKELLVSIIMTETVIV